MDKVQNLAIPSVIHHRQNPLESNIPLSLHFIYTSVQQELGEFWEEQY
jgi:hypothetical protein